MSAKCLDVTKPYEFIRFGALDVTTPYEFIGFGALEVTKPREFIWFGALDVIKPCEFIGFGALDGPKSAREACAFPNMLSFIIVVVRATRPLFRGQFSSVSFRFAQLFAAGKRRSHSLVAN